MVEKQITKQAQTETKQTEPGKRRKTSAGKVQLGLWIDKNLYKDMQIRAIELDLNTSILLEDAIREYLNQHKKA